MFDLKGKRASILPPTLPKSRFNPVTKIIAYPVKVVIDSFIRQSSIQTTAVSTADLLAQERRRQQQAAQAQPLGLGLMSHRMGLQGMTFVPPGGAGVGTDPNYPTVGGAGVGIDPGLLVFTPGEPDTPITETDTEEDLSISAGAPPVSVVPPITTQIADQIISGGGLPTTPDATTQIARVETGVDPSARSQLRPPVVTPIAPPSMGPTTYTYKDIQGHVVFNLENLGMSPMNLSALVSARIGDVELVRTNFKTQLMPQKARQFQAEFILEGDQSAFIKMLKGDLTGDTPFPEAVTLTVDAVIGWHLFRNSVSKSIAVPLETKGTF